MITIIGYKLRTNEDGENFYTLTVQGGLQTIKSKKTGKFYASAKKASLPSTFDEDTCKGLIGTQITGSIMKVNCEPYEYVIPDTGESIELSHRWEFVPEGETTEEVIFEEKVLTPKEEEEPALV